MRILPPILALLLLLGGCTPGYYHPPPTPMHHFESPDELHIVGAYGWHGALAWNPIFSRDTSIDTNQRWILFVNDSTDEYDERDTTTIDTTDRSRTLYLSLSGTHFLHTIEEIGRVTSMIDGEIAVGVGQRTNGWRVDAVAALGVANYDAVDEKDIITAATVLHLRPSFSVSVGLTSISGPTRSGVAFGLIGRVAHPIVLSTTNDTLSRTRPLYDFGWYFHSSLGRPAQLEMQFQFTGAELFESDIPENIWSHISGTVGLRVRLVDLF